MRRRAVGLVVAMVIATLVTTTMVLFSVHIAQLARQRQHDRARTYARVLLDSGVAYVQAHGGPLRADPPKAEFILPTDGLVPAPAAARLTLLAQNDGTIRIRARAELRRAHATEEVCTSPP
jgi:hypothetical protein